MALVVADTDVLIDALCGRAPMKGRIALEIERQILCTTAINAFELLSGAKKKKEQEKIQTLLEAMEILTLDEEAVASAATIRRELEWEGLGIGMADYLIAGLCLSRSLPLLTRNIKHFERVPGLQLLNIHSS